MISPEQDAIDLVCEAESCESPVAARGKALVVEDGAANRALLEILLRKEGFQVISAEDGRQGVTLFESEGADIVFMDVMMPVMDGYEATRRIKDLSGDHFVPVIFLTALNNENALAKCVEAGGDDFLVKPYQHTLLKAKISAAERTRDLYRKVQLQHEELRVLHEILQREQEIAEHIFTNAVTATNVATNSLRTLLRPAATFNGDLVLTARRPSGDLNILLGDFTGHGLAAAVGALPVSEVFRAMTAKGFSASDILKEINRKLASLLPAEMFMAACFLTVQADLRSVSAWNGGMPDILIVDRNGKLRGRVPSSHHPLGISNDLGAALEIERVRVSCGDRILLYSDGLTEACDPSGEMFGESRIERIIQQCNRGDEVFDSITAALDDFCCGQPQDDDVTLVDIPCEPVLTAALRTEKRRKPQQSRDAFAGLWRWALELHAPGLRSVDPVPLAMAQLLELHELSTQREALYTVLSELFNNALDHGVLELDSGLKTSAAGFADYYLERERRLAALDEGFVRIELVHVPEGRRGSLIIRLEDTGKGFDYNTVLRNAEANTTKNIGYAGRGIPLLASICKSLRYEGNGNRVEAVYAWEYEV